MTTKTHPRRVFSLAGLLTRSALLHPASSPALALGNPVQSRPDPIASHSSSSLTAPSMPDVPTGQPNVPADSRQPGLRGPLLAYCLLNSARRHPSRPFAPTPHPFVGFGLKGQPHVKRSTFYRQVRPNQPAQAGAPLSSSNSPGLCLPFRAAPVPQPSVGPAGPRRGRGGATRLFEAKGRGTSVAEGSDPRADGVGIPFQRLGYRRRSPALGQKPESMPPFPLPRCWRSIHAFSQVTCIQLPPFKKFHYVPHTQHHRHSTSLTEYRNSSAGLALCSFHLGISLGPPSSTVRRLPATRSVLVSSEALRRDSLSAYHVGCYNTCSGFAPKARNFVAFCIN